jgi:hypothetical protein
MPLSSVLGASTAIRPGVCTSSTRPSVPYTGQTIFETNTKRLVIYDGASWVYVADADTPPGLELVKAQTSFTTASTITVDNVFTSAFTNYKIIVNCAASTTSNAQMRLRGSGSSISTSTYNAVYLLVTTASTIARLANQTEFRFGTFETTRNYYEITIGAPQLAQATTFMSEGLIAEGANYTTMRQEYWRGANTNATAYDGIEIYPNTGTFTGTYAIYGYRI